MLTEVQKRPEIQEVMNSANALVLKSVEERLTLTEQEWEDLRHDISYIRYRMSTEVLPAVSNETSMLELRVGAAVTEEFGKYYKMYSSAKEEGTNKLKYSKSGAESFARNTYKMEGTKYYNLMIKYNHSKAFLDSVYQVLKSLDQVANSIAPMPKRKII